jgi:hypothetical protein
MLREGGQQRGSSSDEGNCAHAGMTVVHAAISPRIPPRIALTAAPLCNHHLQMVTNLRKALSKKVPHPGTSDRRAR